MSKKHLLTIASGAVILLLGILILITGEFLFLAAFHIFTRILCVVAIVWLIRKIFREQISHDVNKASVLCGVVGALDLVVAGGIRFVLSGGESGVLLFPVCLPLMFMIIMHYTFAEKRDKIHAFLIGIPLLILSVLFEILSFAEIV